MTALTNNLMPPATLWVLTINTIALIGFACAPLAQDVSARGCRHPGIPVRAGVSAGVSDPRGRSPVSGQHCPGLLLDPACARHGIGRLLRLQPGDVAVSAVEGRDQSGNHRSRRGLSVLLCGVPMLRSRDRGANAASRIDAGRCLLDRAVCGRGIVGVLADARRRRGVHRVCLVADRASPAGGRGDDAPRGRRQLSEALPRLRGGAGVELVARQGAA